MEWLSILAGYLLGSLPTAVWIGKKYHQVDVREHGSKNAGATNTIRVLGWKTGLVVLLLDMAKGYGAVKTVMYYVLPPEENTLLLILIATATVLGHIFPLFAKFRGGKGIATMAGISIALFPLSLLILLGLFLALFLTFRYVSLGSILAAISLPFLSFYIEGNQEPELVVFTILIALIVPATHHKNIKRLLRGEEKKLKPQ